MSETWVSNGLSIIQIEGVKENFASETLDNLKTTLKLLSKLKQPPEVFYKKGVLKNFGKFIAKHLCRRPATLLRKRL